MKHDYSDYTGPGLMVATVLFGLAFAHYLHVKRDRDFYREEAFNALKITKGEGSRSA